MQHGERHLWIESGSTKITEGKVEASSKLLGQFTFSSILGILNMEEKRYLVIASEVETVAELGKQRVYRIKTVLFVPLNYETQRARLAEESDILRMRKLLQTRFYFSVNGDITLSQQRMEQKHATDASFAWNHRLLKPFVEQQISAVWVRPIMFGSIDVLEEKRIVLISRLSRKQFFGTGIDDQGNVSHFIETEMVIVKDEQLYSYVCLRGSVPVFWEQERLSQQPKVTKSQDLSKTACDKHFHSLRATYGQVYCLNLLAKGPLSTAYEQCVPDGNYQRIDFHSVTKNTYKAINDHIRLLQPVFDSFGYFHAAQLQKGVFRVNRLYCVDSSNIFVSRLFLLFAEKVFATPILEAFDHKQSTLYLTYKNLWANQADVLSQIYFGTNSVNSDYSRQDKSNILSFFNSSLFQIGRIMQNKPKQSALHMLLHNKRKEPINQFLQHKSQDFSTYLNARIQVITWNMAGKKPQSEIPDLF